MNCIQGAGVNGRRSRYPARPLCPVPACWRSGYFCRHCRGGSDARHRHQRIRRLAGRSAQTRGRNRRDVGRYQRRSDCRSILVHPGESASNRGGGGRHVVGRRETDTVFSRSAGLSRLQPHPDPVLSRTAGEHGGARAGVVAHAGLRSWRSMRSLTSRKRGAEV